MNVVKQINRVLLSVFLVNAIAPAVLYAAEADNAGFLQKTKSLGKTILNGYAHWELDSFKAENEKLSPEVEAEIRDILCEIGIEDYQDIHIYNLTPKMDDNAFASQPIWGCDKFIFVSESFYKTLPNEARRFLIAHEAMHLEYGHVPPRNLLSKATICAAFGVYTAVDCYLNCNYGSNHEKISTYDSTKKAMILKGLSVLSGFFTLSILQLMQIPYWQSQEYEADSQAVNRLSSVDGGVVFLQRNLQKELELEKIIPAFYYQRSFTTHPKTENRIEVLKTIADSNKTPQDVLNDQLFTAIAHDDCAGVTFALSQGADVNAHEFTTTALQKASQRGCLEIMQFLVDNGADINAVDMNGMSVLYYAALANQLEAAAFLCNSGALIDKPNNLHYTPLFGAVYSGFVDMVKLLLDYGAHINLQAHENQTPLHLAVMGGSLDVIIVLLEYGADATIKAGPANLQAAELAEQFGKEEAANILRKS